MAILTVPTSTVEEPLFRTLEASLFTNQCVVIQENMPIAQRVRLLLVRDLLRLGWQMEYDISHSVKLTPPPSYDKAAIKTAMAYSRNEIIVRDEKWIKEHLDIARDNLATGNDVLMSKISPKIEICETQAQHDIFRIFRYFWSSPSSDYVGRRIRILIRDEGLKNNPIIGIAALGSSIIHIPERDDWIGWDKETRSNRIIYMMDAYVIGAMPPYNHLLGGKLVSYILASNELRAIFKKKYTNVKTISKNREASDLALIMTTSLYGENSSQYNRLKYGKKLLYKPVGITSGYGSLHISNETFSSILQLTVDAGIKISNRFGDGPNWRMRVIRSACDILKLDSNVILKHSFQRGLYAVPLTTNFRAFLTNISQKPIYRNLPIEKLTDYWNDRWLSNRKLNEAVLNKVREFNPENFLIEKTRLDK